MTSAWSRLQAGALEAAAVLQGQVQGWVRSWPDGELSLVLQTITLMVVVSILVVNVVRCGLRLFGRKSERSEKGMRGGLASPREGVGAGEPFKQEALASQFSYPHMHLSAGLVDSFRWVAIDDVKLHEHYLEDRHLALYNYLKSAAGPVIVPCLILDAGSLTIIDGHHRFSVMRKLGWQSVPALLLNYFHPDIITHPETPVPKRTVIEAGISGNFLAPKSTQHLIRGTGNHGMNVWHPVACLSVQVLYRPSDHLDTAQQKQLQIDSPTSPTTGELTGESVRTPSRGARSAPRSPAAAAENDS